MVRITGHEAAQIMLVRPCGGADLSRHRRRAHSQL